MSLPAFRLDVAKHVVGYKEMSVEGTDVTTR